MTTDLLDKVSATIIRRINYPRALTRAQNKTSANNAKMRTLLTQEEESETRLILRFLLRRKQASRRGCVSAQTEFQHGG